MASSVPKPATIREAIANSVSTHLKAYDVADFCDRIGVPARPDEGDPFSSKAVFVRYRLQVLDPPALISAARRVLREWDDPDLEEIVGCLGGRGVSGELMNIIFAADGPKPKIVLRDALNNQIEIVKNERYCLIYDRPLTEGGLSWTELVDWWAAKTAPAGRTPDLPSAGRALWQRLNRSATEGPERMVFRWYTERHQDPARSQLPALLPQVFMHYDPFAGLRGQSGSLFRQRMDFLLLFPDRVRVVLEVDGRQHYADNAGVADPARYAAMMAEDRRLRLAGYEVYRFGGQEFVDTARCEAMFGAFFDDLLARHLG